MWRLVALPVASAVSFLTLGDWGAYDLGSYHQTTVTTVAAQMAKTADSNGASFVATGLRNAFL